MADEIIEVDEGGEPRKLATLEQPEELLKFAWPESADTDTTPPLIVRDQWAPVTLESLVLEIHDQNGVGMCASAATCNAVEVAREAAGLDHVTLSGGDMYRRVSGGRDEGSLPEDNLAEILSEGVAPASVVPYLDWRGNHPEAAAARKEFSGLEAWRNPSVEHIASSLQRGFAVLIGYWHYGSDPVDSDGWMVRPGGKRGGHSVLVIGLVNRGGKWGFKFVNTWTPKWGMNGFGILPESRMADGVRSFQAWNLRSVAHGFGTLPPLRS